MRCCLAYDCLYPWTVGGAELWYRNLAERLAADGHEVTYLTRLQWDASDPPDIPGVRPLPPRRSPKAGMQAIPPQRSHIASRPSETLFCAQARSPSCGFQAQSSPLRQTSFFPPNIPNFKGSKSKRSAPCRWIID